MYQKVLQRSSEAQIKSSNNTRPQLVPQKKSILLELGRERVILRTQPRPSRRHNLRLWSRHIVAWPFGEDDGEADLEMPIDMAMEEPCTSIVGLKTIVNGQRQYGRGHQRPNRKVVFPGNVDNIASRWVHEVADIAIRDANNIEGMTVSATGVSVTLVT